MNFPHIDDTAFPNVDNINVYKYKNNFNYKRWDANVKLKLMNVQWDDVNVPGFETVQDRDAYFKAKTGKIETLNSAFHILPDNSIDLPIPFDEMSAYNYIMVEFPIMTSPTEPLDYEHGTGVNKFFYFVWGVESRAGNCSHCMLTRDDWTTFIHFVDVNYMQLKRGHAPLAAVNVDSYLQNPIKNNTLLLAPDVNYGACTNVKTSNDVVLNDGVMYACIATTADPTMDWGSKGANTWTTPAASMYDTQGTPACYTFAVSIDRLAAFLANVDATVPQFKQTVRAVFFASEKLISLGAPFTFATETCYPVIANQVSLNLLGINKNEFGYDAKYAELAKLYTYPYSQIEIIDESGNVTLVYVEDTTGALDVACALSVAYPLVGIDAHILGYGSSQRRTISFENISQRSITAQGTWYKTLMHWDVPTFAVVQQASIENDYSTHFSRAQQKVAYDNAYSTTVASATTANTNAINAADTGNTNAHLGTAAQTNITTRQTQNNTAKTGEQNSYINAQATLNGDKLSDDTDADRVYLSSATGIATDAIASSAWTNAATGVAANIGTGLMAGGLAGAGAGAVGGIISGASTAASSSIIISKDTSMAALSEANMLAKFRNAYTTLNSLTARTNTYNTDITNLDNSTATDTTNISVTAMNTQADNTAATSKANANRTFNTTVSNAGTNRDTAIYAVQNQIAQAGLSAPGTFGNYAGDSTAVTRPMIVSANVVTQPKAAIAQAGDQMLRYGYALNQQWNVSTFNVMTKFSYWQTDEVWLTPASGVVEGAREHIQDMFRRGVTVWTNPDEIGKVSIYDNKPKGVANV